MTLTSPINVPGASLQKSGRVHWMITISHTGAPAQRREFSCFSAAQNWLEMNASTSPALEALWDELENQLLAAADQRMDRVIAELRYQTGVQA